MSSIVGAHGIPPPPGTPITQAGKDGGTVTTGEGALAANVAAPCQTMDETLDMLASKLEAALDRMEVGADNLVAQLERACFDLDWRNARRINGIRKSLKPPALTLQPLCSLSGAKAPPGLRPIASWSDIDGLDHDDLLAWFEMYGDSIVSPDGMSDKGMKTALIQFHLP